MASVTMDRRALAGSERVEMAVMIYERGSGNDADRCGDEECDVGGKRETARNSKDPVMKNEKRGPAS